MRPHSFYSAFVPVSHREHERRHSKQDAVVALVHWKINQELLFWLTCQSVCPTRLWKEEDNGFEVSEDFHQHNGAASLFPFFSLNCGDSIGARSSISVKMLYYSKLVLVAQSVGGKNQSINFMDTYSKMLLIIHYFTKWKRRRR